MKLLLAATVMTLVVESSAQWHNFPGQAIQGAGDMWRAYRDMKKANWINSDKYFHARGNYDAAQRGPGGKWAAEVISDARERTQEIIGHLLPCTGYANSLKSEVINNAAEWMHEKMGHHASDSEADQFANRWGREGQDPNHFRPEGLPEEY